MALKPEDFARLEATVAEAAAKRKEIRNREKYEPTKAQKQIEHLTDEQAEELKELQLQMASIIQKNVMITATRKKDEKTPTKRDMKRGKNNNQGAEGVHSNGYREDLIKLGNQLVKHAYEHHGIKELKEIKPRMAEELCRTKMENGDWAFTTLGTRITQLKKIGESGAKAGIKHYSRLITTNTTDLKKEFKPDGKLKDQRTRGKKKSGKNKGKGYQVKEARTIAKHAGDIYGPMGRVMVDILAEAGPRVKELMKLKWEHFDFSTGTMGMTQKNMTKGGRPRIIEDLSPKTLRKLQDIHESGLFKNPKQTIFRSHFHSEKNVRTVVEEAARSGKVANLGLHAFRNATKEYQTKNFKKQLEKYQKDYGKEKGKKMFKEMMAEKMMRYVGADEKLNPVINDETGERRFEYDKLINRRVDRVINDVVTQMFGHNRRDVLAVY